MRTTPLKHAIVVLALAATVALAQEREGRTSPTAARGMELLFAADDARIESIRGALEEQDITRIDISICVDPSEMSLSGSSELSVRSSGDVVSLVLDRHLQVLSVSDRTGEDLSYARRGEVLEILSSAAEAGSMSEIQIRYGGPLSDENGLPGCGDYVVLGPGLTWYPNSEWRDPAVLRVEVRYPVGYSSVVSGTLAGMAPTLEGDVRCAAGDVWDVPTPVPHAVVVVGKLDSSLTVVGDVFIGYHRPSDRSSDGPLSRASAPLHPEELSELVRFLETCYGPYPFEWLNVVALPGDAGPVSTWTGPGLVFVGEFRSRAGRGTGATLERLAPGLTDSWWAHWTDLGELASDGLAAYAETRWLRALGDEDRAARRRSFHREEYLSGLRDSSGRAPLSLCLGPEPTDDDRLCKGKGGLVFGMLEHLIGEGPYCASLRTLGETRGGEAVSFRELVRTFEDASGRDLGWFFNEWVSRTGLPSYAVDYEVVPRPNGTYSIKGAITQGGDYYRTPLPLTIDLGGWAYEEVVDVESPTQPFEIVTDVEPMHVIVDSEDLIPKIDREERARIHHELGAAAAAAGDWKVAVDELGAAAALEPGDPAYAHSYGQALVRSGALARGLAELSLAVDLEPSDPARQLELGRLYLSSGDCASALRHLEVYVELAPDDVLGQAALSEALTGLGRLGGARDALERSRALMSEATVTPEAEEAVHLAAGALEEALGSTSAAQAAYEAALEANPVSDEARRRLQILRLSSGER